MNFTSQDTHWLRHALELAQHAETQGEVPVGAALVFNDELVASGWNQPIKTHDPSNHAEIVAIRAAGQQMQNYRLPQTTLYVTLEPCLMCIGAILHARIKRLVFGAYDPRAGAVGSVIDVREISGLNHKLECFGGLLRDECANLLKTFFQKRRTV